MGRKFMLALTLLLSLLAAPMQTARATTFLRLESSYLGDGWFQYHVTLMNDPFFSFAYVGGVYIRFTNQIDQTTASPYWVNSNELTQVDWAWDGNYAPARPYEFTILNRSSEPAYRLGTVSNFDGCIVSFALATSGLYDRADSFVGFATLPCLLPCSADLADNSPTNFVSDLKVIPDVAIDRLVQTNGHIYGVDFMWDTNSTFILQGTSDFNNWTNISYIWSTPPQTVWTTNQFLDNYGQFYRLALVAYYYLTNPPPLTSNMAQKSAVVVIKSAPSLPRVTSCVPVKGKMQVNIVANQDQRCTVQALTAERRVILEKNVEVKGTTGSVMFDAAKLPTPVFFQVLAR